MYIATVNRHEAMDHHYHINGLNQDVHPIPGRVDELNETESANMIRVRYPGTHQ